MAVPAGAIEEVDYLEATREDLLREHLGRYVVIERRSVLGSFASEEEAFRAGVRACGTAPFLIAHMEPGRERAWIPLLAEVGPAAAGVEEFVPHDSWRRGEFIDDLPTETATPLPPGAGRRRGVPDEG